MRGKMKKKNNQGRASKILENCFETQIWENIRSTHDWISCEIEQVPDPCDQGNHLALPEVTNSDQPLAIGAAQSGVSCKREWFYLD